MVIDGYIQQFLFSRPGEDANGLLLEENHVMAFCQEDSDWEQVLELSLAKDSVGYPYIAVYEKTRRTLRSCFPQRGVLHPL